MPRGQEPDRPRGLSHMQSACPDMAAIKSRGFGAEMIVLLIANEAFSLLHPRILLPIIDRLSRRLLQECNRN